jgi:hypothetical protein
MEEEIIIIEENTQVTNKIDVVEEGVSVHQRIDFDLCGENSITIVSTNSN